MYNSNNNSVNPPLKTNGIGKTRRRMEKKKKKDKNKTNNPIFQIGV
jgi:hypothetical protein